MKARTRNFIILCSLLSLAAQPSDAQVKRRQKPKPAQKQNALAVADFYPSAAKLMVIDSVVVDKENFAKHIPLRKEYGQIGKYTDIFNSATQTSHTSSAFLNGFDDLCIYNKTVAKDSTLLFMAEKIGNEWKAGRAIEEFADDFKDVDYPYLMPDGVTLYFSAINKKNGFGKRDIFISRLNTETQTFYKPENLGLPYNSEFNDYMCVVDDIDSLGWLVTDRHQESGKVCIYTFIPSDERWSDDENISEEKLKSVATLRSIKDTQYDRKLLDESLRRMNTHTSSDKARHGFRFVINDDAVYTDINDFKSDTARGLFLKLMQLNDRQADIEKKLPTIRKGYRSKGKGVDRKTILKMEEDLENIMIQKKNLEKKIRNAENL